MGKFLICAMLLALAFAVPCDEGLIKTCKEGSEACCPQMYLADGWCDDSGLCDLSCYSEEEADCEEQVEVLCGEGFIKTCVKDSDECCSNTYLNDGNCDNWGLCDLSCHPEEANDCAPPSEEELGVVCGEGTVLTCNEGSESCCPEMYLGDGWCDDEGLCDLTCYSAEEADCEEQEEVPCGDGLVRTCKVDSDECCPEVYLNDGNCDSWGLCDLSCYPEEADDCALTDQLTEATEAPTEAPTQETDCMEGEVKTCIEGKDTCCPASYLGDGWCDNNGFCDLRCYEEEVDDCPVQDPEHLGEGCPNGFIKTCAEGSNSCCSKAFLDNGHCDNWGLCDLSCYEAESVDCQDELEPVEEEEAVEGQEEEEEEEEEGCDDDEVPDCTNSENCCPKEFLGDDWCDNGGLCDLTCYDEETADCDGSGVPPK